MNVVLYFDELPDLLSGIQVVKNVAKFLSDLTVDFVSREKFSFPSGGQEISVHSVDELASIDCDYVICCNAVGGGR